MKDFPGFEYPKQNWSRLPNQFFMIWTEIQTLAEMRVILYILRHTWGFNEFGESKVITMDEFANGRKDKQGKRIDSGCGMSEISLRDGLKRAENHQFIVIETDKRDPARIHKGYMLRMHTDTEDEANEEQNQGVRNLPPEGQKLTARGSEIDPRSEKDTIERQIRKKGGGATAPAPAKPKRKERPPKSEAVTVYHDMTHCWPNALQEKAIDAAVKGDDDIPKWRDVIEEWRMRGFSPVNVRGMLDWFVNGIRSNGGKKDNRGRSETYQRNVVTPEEWAAAKPYTEEELDALLRE